MLLFILPPMVAFLYFAVRYKRRNKTADWVQVAAKTWQNHFIANDAWILWLVVFFFLGVIKFFFTNSFDQISYDLSTLGTQIAYTVMLGLIIWGIVLLINFLFGSKRSVERDTSYGSASWTPFQLLQQIGITQFPTRQSNYLYMGSMFFNDRQGHLLTIAGSRSGKGACIIVPNLLLPNQDSFVVTDPKGENAYMTARYQAQTLGKKVVILDPWGEQNRLGATHKIESMGFNPLDFIKSNPEELTDNCNLVAEMIVPNNPNAKEPFWDNSARAIIKTYLMHLLTFYPESEHNLWTIYKWLRYDTDERITLWAEMKISDELEGLVSIAAGEFLHFDGSSNTLSSIISTAHDATRFLESKQIRSSISRSNFNPYELTQGNVTVYIVLPERFFGTHSRWLRLVTGLCLRACNHRPKERVNFLLDEFAVLGRLDDVKHGYAFAAGQNIRIWSFVQNLGQLKSLYGEEGIASFIGCQTFQAFGIDDHFTAETISKMLGDSTITVKNTSYSTSKSTNSGRSFSVGNNSHNIGSGTTSASSISYNKTGRALMTAEEVGKTNKIIYFFRDGQDKYKFTGNRWRYFDPSPFSNTKKYNPATDSYERMRLDFATSVDLLPQFKPSNLIYR